MAILRSLVISYGACVAHGSSSPDIDPSSLFSSKSTIFGPGSRHGAGFGTPETSSPPVRTDTDTFAPESKSSVWSASPRLSRTFGGNVFHRGSAEDEQADDSAEEQVKSDATRQAEAEVRSQRELISTMEKQAKEQNDAIERFELEVEAKVAHKVAAEKALQDVKTEAAQEKKRREETFTQEVEIPYQNYFARLANDQTKLQERENWEVKKLLDQIKSWEILTKAEISALQQAADKAKLELDIKRNTHRQTETTHDCDISKSEAKARAILEEAEQVVDDRKQQLENAQTSFVQLQEKLKAAADTLQGLETHVIAARNADHEYVSKQFQEANEKKKRREEEHAQTLEAQEKETERVRKEVELAEEQTKRLKEEMERECKEDDETCKKLRRKLILTSKNLSKPMK